jgi:hypothetical protein
MVRTQVLAMAMLAMVCGSGAVASGQDFAPGWVGEIKGSPDVFGDGSVKLGSSANT